MRLARRWSPVLVLVAAASAAQVGEPVDAAGSVRVEDGSDPHEPGLIAEPCALLPELAMPDCTAPEAGGQCVWVTALEALAAGELARADLILAEGFGLPESSAARLRRAAQRWMPLLIEESSCPFESTRPSIEGMIAVPELEGVVLQMRLQGLSPDAAEAMLGADPEPSQEDVHAAIGRLVDLIAPAVADASSLSRRVPVYSPQPLLPTFEAWPSELETLVEPLEAVDALLLDEPEELVTSLRDLEVELPAEVAAMVWVRAGFGLLLSGRVEDGSLALHRAEDLFRLLPDPSSKAAWVRVLGASFRAALSQYFQLQQEASRILADASAGAGRLKRWFLELAAHAPLTLREASAATPRAVAAQKEMLSLVMSGEISAAELKSMEQAVLITLPGFAASQQRPDPPAATPGIPEVVGALLIGDFARGMERWQHMTRDSRFADHLMWPAMVTAAAVRSGRIGPARRTLEQGIAYVEEILGGQRSSEVSRPMIDQVLARYYPQAVELAMFEKDPAAAFEYAERGRAFVLHRALGLGSSRLPGAPSEREKELEEQAVALTGPPKTPKLERVRREFEAERFGRLLATASATPAPGRTSLGDVQAALQAEERLIAYFPGLEKMWLWSLDRQHVLTVSIGWAPAVEQEIRELRFLLAQAVVGSGPCSEMKDRGGEPIAQPLGPCHPSQHPATGPIDPARRLYDLLVAPVDRTFPGAETLIFVPHSVLHGVPFAALQDASGRRLAVGYRVGVLPGAAGLSGRGRTNPSGRRELRMSRKD